MMQDRIEKSFTAGDPVEVQGWDRTPRKPWLYAIRLLVVLIIVGLGMAISTSTPGRWYTLNEASAVARAGLYVLLGAGVALGCVMSAEYLIHWNRRDRLTLHASRDGITYRVNSANQPERSERWPPEQIVGVTDTSNGLSLALRSGAKVSLPLGRSSEDSRELANEVMAALALAREDRP